MYTAREPAQRREAADTAVALVAGLERYRTDSLPVTCPPARPRPAPRNDVPGSPCKEVRPGEFAAGRRAGIRGAVRAVLLLPVVGVRAAAVIQPARRGVHHHGLPRGRRHGTPHPGGTGRRHGRHRGATARPPRLAAGPQLQPQPVQCLRASRRLARPRHAPQPRLPPKGLDLCACGRVPVPEWRAIRGRGQGIHWPYC